jgi:hypothetical protein
LPCGSPRGRRRSPASHRATPQPSGA